MPTYTIALKGLEASITLDSGAETTRAYGIAFDENGDTISETESRRFSGFCDSEIVYDIASELLTTRRQIESEGIADALEAIGLVCACED